MFESNDDDDVLDELFDIKLDAFDKSCSLNTRNQSSEEELCSRSEPIPLLFPHNETVLQRSNNPGSSSNQCFENLDSKLMPRTSFDSSRDADENVLQSNKENKRRHAVSPTPIKAKRERKFPGPAGLLPDRKLSGKVPVKLDFLLETDESPLLSSRDELRSEDQCSGSVLEEEPWQTFLADLGPDRNILAIINVANIKRKAAARCFVGKKLPFFAAVLHHLDVSSPDPCIVLRDSSGEIHGTLHREVWDQFADNLTIGSVIVVKNVGLLSTGLSSRRHYLNITAHNLVTIYSASSGKTGFKRIYGLSGLDCKDIITSWNGLVSPALEYRSPLPLGSPALFNSSFGSPVSSLSENQRNLNSSGNVLRKTLSSFSSTVIPQHSRSNNVEYCHSLVTPKTAISTPIVHSRVVSRSLSPFNSHKNSLHTESAGSADSRSPNIDSRLLHSTNRSNSYQSVAAIPQAAGSNLSTLCHALDIPNISRQEVIDYSNADITPKTVDTRTFLCHSVDVNSNENRQTRSLGSVSGEASTSSRTNNPKPVPQSPELTQEELSMLESVFDGIDVDSLFDDF